MHAPLGVGDKVGLCYFLPVHLFWHSQNTMVGGGGGDRRYATKSSSSTVGGGGDGGDRRYATKSSSISQNIVVGGVRRNAAGFIHDQVKLLTRATRPAIDYTAACTSLEGGAA